MYKSIQYFYWMSFLIILSQCSPINSQSSINSDLELVDPNTLAYFIEIALGSEFSNSPNPQIIKWKKNVSIYVIGEKPSYLLSELREIVEEINSLSPNINLAITKKPKQANLLILLGDAESYQKIERSAKPYLKDNRGLFMVYFNEDFEIYRATIFVDTKRVKSKKAQRHLLREELTQSLGLMKDSFRYPDSIFYANWSETNEYSKMDKLLIQILYHPMISPGFRADDIEKVWETL